MNRLSTEFIELVLKYRTEGKTYTEIYELTKISKKKIWNILRANRMVNGHQYKTMNHNFFEMIDTEEKSYILGLLMADGTISTKRNTVSITLKEEDSYILETLNKFMNCSLPLNIASRYKDSVYMRTTINSEQLVNDLIKWGCVEHKTYKNEHFPNILSQFHRHFIRGYFDGDGHIGMHKSKNNRINYVFDILVQDNYRQGFMKIIEDATGVKLNYHRKKECKNHLFNLRTGVRENLIKIHHYLYSDSTLFLRRKKDVWDKIVKNISHKQNH